MLSVRNAVMHKAWEDIEIMMLDRARQVSSTMHSPHNASVQQPMRVALSCQKATESALCTETAMCLTV